MGLQVCTGGRTFLKTEFFFKPGELPDNYHQVHPACHTEVLLVSNALHAVSVVMCILQASGICFLILLLSDSVG